jgi:acetolactate synthase I/II/III large subunit
LAFGIIVLAFRQRAIEVAVEQDAQTVAEAWLRLLAARGVDYLFANSGTDFPPIVEALARAEQYGLPVPRAVIAPHENAAVAMAHGHAVVSGRAQAVMVHVNVGTANCVAGLINAERDYVPMLLAAGRTPVLESGAPGARSLNIHWAQEMFDQAGLVRETVRWDYELRDPRQLHVVTERALALAHSAPRGPVYLALPRELLAMPPATNMPTPRIAPTSPCAPDPAGVVAAARLLSGARQPLIVTARAGADVAVPALLGRLATRLGAPVVEYRPRHMNLSTAHSLHGGFEVAPWLAEADVVLVLDCDAPWMPATDHTQPGVTVIQAGEDPLQARYPVRGFPADLSLQGAARLVLEALLAELGVGTRPAGEAAARCGAIREAGRRTVKAPPARMTMAWASACLDRARAPSSILVNEYPLVRPVMQVTEPGSYFGSSPAGALGWGLPAAMGAKLATPDREVIAAVGDGSHIFANPVACHQIAAAEGIPVLSVVFNNGGWGAVSRATRAMYPEGHAVRANVMPVTRLSPVPGYAAVAEACGVAGFTAADPASLPAVLEQALTVVRTERRAALVDILCDG